MIGQFILRQAFSCTCPWYDKNIFFFLFSFLVSAKNSPGIKNKKKIIFFWEKNARRHFPTRPETFTILVKNGMTICAHLITSNTIVKPSRQTILFFCQETNVVQHGADGHRSHVRDIMHITTADFFLSFFVFFSLSSTSFCSTSFFVGLKSQKTL